jgi:hypothetical protein
VQISWWRAEIVDENANQSVKKAVVEATRDTRDSCRGERVMFDGSSLVGELECPAWDAARADSRVDWKRVDRELRAIAKKRAALDAEEARWLREAERLQIWRPLGMVSPLDYMERVLGYTPHTARERLRVAKALAEVPTIAESFAAGS